MPAHLRKRDELLRKLDIIVASAFLGYKSEGMTLSSYLSGTFMSRLGILGGDHMFTRLANALLILVLLSPLAALAQNPQGTQVDPTTLAAKDAHDNLTISVDPYTTAERYKEAFGKNSMYDSGIIAVQVYCRNDNDLPIRINFESLELLISLPGHDRQHLTPLTPEDVANRALLKANANPTVPSHLPLPGLRKSGPGKAWNEMVSYLHSVEFPTDVLPPRATTHGFLFFDMNHDFGAIRDAHLYIPDVWFMTNKKALLFFDVDLSASRTH